MDFTEIRELVIISMFSDDILFSMLVLKGGNALRIIHKLGSRASLDVDFSIDGDFDDVDSVADRIFRALRSRFESAGYVVFDERFRATSPGFASRWGGYLIEFKIITRSLFEQLHGEKAALSRQAEVTGPGQQRVFRVQISKHEFCESKEEAEIRGYTVYVYSPEMIAIEKLRAICQQMPEYEARAKKSPRGRDFYDIHCVVTEAAVDLVVSRNLKLFKLIFAAKDVPLSLLGRIEKYKDFHSQDWPSVVASVSGDLKDFGYYFDFVVAQVDRLESLWVE